MMFLHKSLVCFHLRLRDFFTARSWALCAYVSENGVLALTYRAVLLTETKSCECGLNFPLTRSTYGGVFGLEPQISGQASSVPPD